jgi:hypothetical protein
LALAELDRQFGFLLYLMVAVRCLAVRVESAAAGVRTMGEDDE